MSNQFKFVGKIKKLKSNAYHEKSFESGWMTQDYTFLIQCGNDSHMLKISTGKFEDDSRNVVYSFTKSEGDKKGESVKIDWNDRKNPEVIKTIAGFKKYIVDTVSLEERSELKDSDEDAYNESLKNKKEYIHSYDFLKTVMNMIENDKFGEEMYVVSGDFEISYDFKKDTYYRTFAPTKIYKANKDQESSSIMGLELYLTRNSFKDSESNNDCIVDAYVQYYASSEKKNFFAPIQCIIKEDNQKREGIKKIVKSRLENADSVCKFGFTVYAKNGAEKVQVDKDSLTTDQKEMIELGLMTLEEIQKNTSVYGDRISQNIICEISRNYTEGPKETDYKVKDLTEKPTNGKKDSAKKVESVLDDMDDDII